MRFLLLVLFPIISTSYYFTKKTPKKVIPLVSQSQPPCCTDLIGTLACRRLRKNNFMYFQRRCQDDADFSLLQCCATCGLDQVGHRHGQFFSEGVNSPECFDRHGRAFCEAFIMKKDIWSPANWTCSQPENAHLGFRICRKSCGYCRKDLYADDQHPVPMSPLPLMCEKRNSRWK